MTAVVARNGRQEGCGEAAAKGAVTGTRGKSYLNATRLRRRRARGHEQSRDGHENLESRKGRGRSKKEEGSRGGDSRSRIMAAVAHDIKWQRRWGERNKSGTVEMTAMATREARQKYGGRMEQKEAGSGRTGRANESDRRSRKKMEETEQSRRDKKAKTDREIREGRERATRWSRKCSGTWRPAGCCARRQVPLLMRPPIQQNSRSLPDRPEASLGSAPLPFRGRRLSHPPPTWPPGCSSAA
jgi:hypothetical protein